MASIPTEWWARGSGAEIELGRSLAPMEPLKGQVQLHQGAVQQGGNRRRHSSGDDGQSAVGRAADQGRGAARRCEPGSGAGQPHRRPDGAAEHGPGLRAAGDRLPRDELLDGLQLAHLVVEPDVARADGGLSVAGVRQPVREPRQPAKSERPRSRAGAGRVARPAGQLRRQGEARRVSHQRARRREARAGHARRERQG